MGLKNLIRIEQAEGKRDNGKQFIVYLVSLSEWMAEQGLKEMANHPPKNSKSYKEQIAVIHDHQRSKGTKYLQE